MMVLNLFLFTYIFIATNKVKNLLKKINHSINVKSLEEIKKLKRRWRTLRTYRSYKPFIT